MEFSSLEIPGWKRWARRRSLGLAAGCLLVAGLTALAIAVVWSTLRPLDRFVAALLWSAVALVPALVVVEIVVKSVARVPIRATSEEVQLPLARTLRGRIVAGSIAFRDVDRITAMVGTSPWTRETGVVNVVIATRGGELYATPHRNLAELARLCEFLERKTGRAAERLDPEEFRPLSAADINPVAWNPPRLSTIAQRGVKWGMAFVWAGAISLPLADSDLVWVSLAFVTAGAVIAGLAAGVLVAYDLPLA